MRWTIPKQQTFSDLSNAGKTAIAIVGLCVALCLGLLLIHSVGEYQYEKAQKYNTAVKAETAEMFNYAVDSQQGNVLASGNFTATPTVSIEDISGEYAKIVKTKERYTQHTRTYECGTEKNPRTCTEHYYTWDYHSKDVITTPTLVFLEREYQSSLFSFGFEHRVGCEVIKENCMMGYMYEDSSWFTSEGDLRWYYSVVDGTFWGTIFVTTLRGGINPVDKSVIDISQKTITDTIKDVNSTTSVTVGWWVWCIFCIVFFIGALRAIKT